MISRRSVSSVPKGAWVTAARSAPCGSTMTQTLTTRWRSSWRSAAAGSSPRMEGRRAMWYGVRLSTGWDGTIRLASPEAEADGRGPAAARLPRRRGDVEGRRALRERLVLASPARDAHDGPVGPGGGLVPSVGVAGKALALDLLGGQAREARDELADDARNDLGIRQNRIRRLIVAVPPGGRPRVLAPDNPCKLTWYFDAHIRTLPTRLSKAHGDEQHAPSSESALDSACQKNDMYLWADYDRQIEYEGYAPDDRWDDMFIRAHNCHPLPHSSHGANK